MNRLTKKALADLDAKRKIANDAFNEVYNCLTEHLDKEKNRKARYQIANLMAHRWEIGGRLKDGTVVLVGKSAHNLIHPNGMVKYIEKEYSGPLWEKLEDNTHDQ